MPRTILELRQGECGPDPESESRVRIRIRTSHPDNFQNLTGTSLFKATFVVKFLWISCQYIQRYEPNCIKMPISQCWRIPQKIPGSRSGGGWLPKFNHFFLVHRHICGKIFM